MNESRIRFIVFEGMDNCGKSTLIQSTAAKYRNTREMKFPKTLPSGTLLRMNTEKDFEILFSMFDLLDERKTYLLDRFIISNMVYDAVLRAEDTSLSEYYWHQFNERFRVTTIILTRPPIKTDFIDDRIKMTKEQFNRALGMYKFYGTNYQLLNRDQQDHPSTVNQAANEAIHMRLWNVLEHHE